MAHTPETPDWQFWIDRGGTFTDIVARAPDGRLLCHKVLSEHPECRRDAALQGIRDLLDLAEDAPLPDHAIAAVKMGTTVATNALLERSGEPTVFVTTAGLGDLPAIGDQSRPELFALAIHRPEPLHSRVIEVDERLDAGGCVVRALDEADARAQLEAARSEGYRACAIALLHGHHNPIHEQRLAALAEAAGFTQVSVSHSVSPLIRLLSRAETTVVDAYLSPVLRRYVDRVAAELGDTRLRFMKSDGGLVDAARFRGRDAILSGPAGGIVGCIETARRAGFQRVIGFDMGGTSTDVAHYAGELERTVDTTINGVMGDVGGGAAHVETDDPLEAGPA
ncbi:MAG: hydantoinase/oxoprolinase N-terminal domain-containing protein, partial [Thiohalospira sp.]